jgi:hypothetical protein
MELQFNHLIKDCNKKIDLLNFNKINLYMKKTD